MSRIYKEPPKISKRKMGKTNWHKKIHKYLIIKLKGKQYHYLSGKYKLKPQNQYTFTRMTQIEKTKNTKYW